MPTRLIKRYRELSGVEQAGTSASPPPHDLTVGLQL
jgi:hypothetical protein